MDADRIIHAIIAWDKAQPTVQGVSFVGSYARDGMGGYPTR
jgi:hypothetical protein